MLSLKDSIIREEYIFTAYREKNHEVLENRFLIPTFGDLKTSIQESYKKTSILPCFEFLCVLQKFLQGKISKDTFDFKLEKLKFGFEVINSNDSCIKGDFLPSTGKVLITITKDLISSIRRADEDTLKLISLNFWTNFVHEDTHKQQFNKCGFNLDKKYVKLENTTFYNGKLQNVEYKYFDQSIEADAYGREIGARLSVIYNNNIDGIYESISNNSISDEYIKEIINVYKDPRISDKNSRKFYRALFDVVENNED